MIQCSLYDLLGNRCFGFLLILIILIQAGEFGLGDDDEDEDAEDLENARCLLFSPH